MKRREFRKLRKANGLSQRQAAEYIGVSLSCVRHWEQAVRETQLYGINAMKNYKG